MTTKYSTALGREEHNTYFMGTEGQEARIREESITRRQYSQGRYYFKRYDRSQSQNNLGRAPPQDRQEF